MGNEPQSSLQQPGEVRHQCMSGWTPCDFCRTSAAILARLQLKRLMSQEVASVEVACKRPRIRIRLKSSLEVVEAAINERDTRRRERADVEGSEPPLLAGPRIEG